MSIPTQSGAPFCAPPRMRTSIPSSFSPLLRVLHTPISPSPFRVILGRFQGDFGDFRFLFVAPIAGIYGSWCGPRLSIRGRPLIGRTRGPRYLQCKAAPQQDPDLSGSLSAKGRSPRLQSKLGKGSGSQRGHGMTVGARGGGKKVEDMGIGSGKGSGS